MKASEIGVPVKVSIGFTWSLFSRQFSILDYMGEKVYVYTWYAFGVPVYTQHTYLYVVKNNLRFEVRPL